MSEPQPIPSLADVLAEHWPADEQYNWPDDGKAWIGCDCGEQFGGHIGDGNGKRQWAEHVQDAYWAARTVHTAEQLDALPNESMYMATHEIALAEQKCGEVWKSVGNTDPFEPGLPGRVLWLPGEGERK
jgi:hypothetical protein